MTLSQRLEELVRAAFSGVWVHSAEHDDAEAEVAALCRDRGWTLAAWDVDRGMSADGRSMPDAADPLAALRALKALATPDGTAVLLLRNFHHYLRGPEVIQAVDTRLSEGRRDRTFIMVLSAVVQLPPELERQFMVVDHELPGRGQLEDMARSVAAEPGELPEGDGLAALLDAAAGLTRVEAENSFALSLVRHGRLAPGVLWELKAQALRKGGLLTLYRGGETFADLGGMGALKAFCARALRPGRPAGVNARGVLLLGPPGSGKSAFCKALGAETGRPTLVLDVGALLGSLVGESEANVRRALGQVDAMAPCVVMIDEVEKAFAGASGGGRGDSGVSARVFAGFLTWLNDHDSDAFVVCTANDVSGLPPEFARAERFDGCFFLDLPGAAGRDEIWAMYLARYGLDPAQRRPHDAEFTGAEVRGCCRLAALLGVSLVEAAHHIVPVAVTAGEAVERLRNWAAGRCLSAERPGLYTRATAGAVKGPRGLRRPDPSSN